MINYAYFKRFFKESSIFLIVTTIIFSLINFIIMTQNDIKPSYSFEYFTSFVYPLFMLLFIGPLYVLNYKDSKRKVDVFYSLPISRVSFLSTRLLVFLLDSFIIYSISYFTGVFASLLDVDSPLVFNYGYVVLYFIATFLTFIPLFFFTTYFANKGNSIFDKFVIMIFYTFGLIAIFYCLASGFNRALDFILRDVQFYGSPYFYAVSPLVYFAYLFSQLILKNNKPEIVESKINSFNNAYLPATIIYIILGLVLLFLLLREEKLDKTERVGQTSNTIFGYKVIMSYIPYIIFGCFPIGTIFGSALYYNLIVLSLGLFITTYFIYKRKFIIQKDAIIYSAFFVVNLIIVSVCSA